jgi:spermidine/putrescine transport system substrate-binding protein
VSDRDRTRMDDVMHEGMRRQLTRRGFLRAAGGGAAAVGLGGLLAACGGDSGTAGGGGATSEDPSKIFSQPAGDTVHFANWPLYIDKAKDSNGDIIYPSLENFTKDTGIAVDYQDIIQDNASFFGKLQPQLQAGDATGWDIIVITNGEQFTALLVNDWVLPLDTTKRPNFDKYAADFARNPSYDPGNKHSMPWQSGLTGIGVNHDLVNGEVTKLDDLANPNIVGQSSVDMLKGDMPDFVMINLGIDPKTSGPAEWKEAAAWLQKQKDSGTVRQYTDQAYIDDMTAGNTSAFMAWSGDVLYYKLWAAYDNLDFVFPDGGALLWIDNMLIPQGAANPTGALQLMDYVYKPEIATMITEWVLYMSPCGATRELIKKDAAKAESNGDKGLATKLNATADNPFLYPDQQLLSQTSFARDLKTDDERNEFHSIFDPISES